MQEQNAGPLHSSPRSVAEKRSLRFIDPLAWTYRAERVQRSYDVDRYALSICITADIRRDVEMFSLLQDFIDMLHNADPRTGADFAQCLWWEYLTDLDRDALRYTLDPTDYIRTLVVPYGRAESARGWGEER